jgi:glycosyltransferase involved in cell wall biosynthesis
MNNAPKHSICIPTYNQVQFIRAAVESALAQTSSSFEVVVSDNHCTDGTSEYLATIKDGRLRVVRPLEHLHVALNHDFVVGQSRGEYVSILSSDNVLEPNYSARMCAFLDSHPTASFAYCASVFIDGHGKQTGLERNIGGSRLRSSDEALERFFRGTRCVFDTLLMRRTAFDRCGKLAMLRNGSYFKELPDWDLDIRLALCGDVAYLDEVLVQFRFWEAENRENNYRRLPRYVEEIGRMFDTTVAEVVAARPQLRGAAAKARRAMAVNCAIGVGQLWGRESYAPAEKDVLRIHDSVIIRAILTLHKIRLTPALEFSRTVKARLRLLVKELLYQG